MSGAELIPELAMIVHELIIKWWLVWVTDFDCNYELLPLLFDKTETVCVFFGSALLAD